MKRIVFFAALLAASCGSNPSGDDIVDADYFPHQLAFSWEYDRNGTADTLGVQFLVHGNRITSVTGLVEEGDVDLVEMTTAGSDTFFTDSLETVTPLGWVGAFRMDGFGVWAYADTLMTDSLQLARFPLVAGDSWVAQVDPEVTAEVVGMEETVTVPDGTFQDVLHISTVETTSFLVEIDTDYWYAPGVGCIRHAISIEDSLGVFYEMDEELVEHFTY